MAGRFRFSRAAYRLLLRLLPAPFRARFAAQMEEDFADLLASRSARRPVTGRVSSWRRALADLSRTIARERGRGSVFSGLRLDLKEAARRLGRTPGFTVTVVLTLGIGLAVATLTFSIVDGIWMRPLPYAHPDRLGETVTSLSSDQFLAVGQQTSAFEAAAGYSLSSPALILPADGAAETLLTRQALVTPNFLETLGVTPLIGASTFDESPGADAGVMLTHRLWVSRFGADRSIVGRSLSFQDRPRRVVAILRSDFTFPVGIPALAPDVLTRLEVKAPTAGQRISTIFRLRPGVSMQQAADVVKAVFTSAPAVPGRSRGIPEVQALSESLIGEYVGSMMQLLLAGVCFLLLIASANLAHLLVAKSAGRAREVAVRRALGAKRVEIVRLLLLDGLLLSVGGGLVAWALSVWAFGAVRSLVPAAIPRATQLALDSRVLVGGFAFTLVVGLLAGLLPAIQLSRPSTEDLLQRGGRGASRRSRLGKILIALEAAFAVVLVASAGLMLNSFVRLARVDTGFHADGVLQMNVVVPSALNEAGAHLYLNRALDRLRALPFVSAVGTTDLPPLTMAARGLQFFGGAAPAQGLQGDLRTVSPGFFGTLGIRMIEGREFSAVDAGGDEPAVLAESAARALFPDGPATGRRIRGNDHEYVVIGVAADIRNFNLKTPPARMLYLSSDRHRPSNVYIMARVAAGRRLDDLAGDMAREVRGVDPRAPFRSVKPLNDLVGDSLADTRLEAILFGVFGVLALAVAVAGVASVTAYGVTRRTHEFGIRLALGSRPARLVRLVVRESLLPAVIGLAVGLGAALALSQVLSRMVFGITAQDPATFGGVIAVLVIAAVIASYVPARRASRLDPTVALRSD